MNDKKYYWLKLEENYFDLKVQKALRKLPSGSDMLICYLKMQLKYLNTGGIIEFQGIYDDLAQELALDIDEEEDLEFGTHFKKTGKLFSKFSYKFLHKFYKKLATLSNSKKSMYLTDFASCYNYKKEFHLKKNFFPTKFC